MSKAPRMSMISLKLFLVIKFLEGSNAFEFELDANGHFAGLFMILTFDEDEEDDVENVEDLC